MNRTFSLVLDSNINNIGINVSFIKDKNRCEKFLRDVVFIKWKNLKTDKDQLNIHQD